MLTGDERKRLTKADVPRRTGTWRKKMPPVPLPQWGKRERYPMRLAHDDFVLYERIVEQSENTSDVVGGVIWRTKGNKATKEAMIGGEPAHERVVFLGAGTPISPDVLAKFKKDTVDGADYSSLCRELNNGEYNLLLEYIADAEAKQAQESLQYYQEVKGIYGEWYHAHGFDLPLWPMTEDEAVAVPGEFFERAAAVVQVCRNRNESPRGWNDIHDWLLEAFQSNDITLVTDPGTYKHPALTDCLKKGVKALGKKWRHKAHQNLPTLREILSEHKRNGED